MYKKNIIDTGPAFLGRGFSTLRRCQIQVNSSYKQILKGQSLARWGRPDNGITRNRFLG